MELSVFLGVFILFFLMIAKIMMKSKPVRLPPGPRKLPIIGNMHQLIGPLPHRILANLAKKYGPVMHLQLGEVSTIIISSAEAVKEILMDHSIIFANRASLLSTRVVFYNGTDIAFSPYGDYWRQLRKICTMELLSPRRVQTFRSIREEEVSNVIKSISLQEGSVVNLSTKIASLAFSLIARAAFGIRSKYHDEFMSAIEELMKHMAGFSIADMYPSVKILENFTALKHKLQSTHRKVDKAIQNILDDHRAKRAESKSGSGESKEDLVDVLLNIQESGEFGAPLTDDNIKAVILNVFAGGGDTTLTTMLWAMAEMMKNPKVIRRAQDEVREIYGGIGNVDESKIHELKYLQAVIKETLRLHPPGPLSLPRECIEKCNVGGYEIPVKARVIINIWAIGQDPNHWNEPEKFEPERFLDSEMDFRGQNFCYIPFSGGKRICPGISFAQSSVQLPLAQLLYHFDWKLPGGLEQDQLDMTEQFGVTVAPKNDLLLIPIPYRPL